MRDQPTIARECGTECANAHSVQRLVRPHVGKSSNRLHPDADNPREVAFALQWSKYQEDGNTLAWLIGRDFSDRDAEVAATIAQWLGSNVGMCFLEDVIKREPKIKEWLAARIVWPNSIIEPKTMHRRVHD